MSEPPRIRVLRGSATPEEEEAARRAIVQLWREDQMRAARAAGANPWVLAARAAATRRDATAARVTAPRDAWRLSGRLSPAESHLQPGRGDAP